ncbi:GNAT family N-acetyltransferase [Lacticaseibacillus suihuaensis]
MIIAPLTQTPHHTAELVDLVNYCQNIEAKLAIKMAEQDDIFQLDDYYRRPGGEFWGALTDDGRLVGCIGLLPLDGDTAVLKKFFTYPDFRGRPHHLGLALYETPLKAAKDRGLTRLVLDTPENEHRSHSFYERQGFTRIDRDQLGVAYAFPDRDSRYYELRLK